MRHAGPESGSIGSGGTGRSSPRRTWLSPGLRTEKTPTLPVRARKARRESSAADRLGATRCSGYRAWEEIYSGAGVVALMDGTQVIPIDMRVELRRGEIGMAEHLLHRAEIGAAFQQVRRECVAERVGRHSLGEPGTPGVGLDDPPRAHARQR